MVCADVCNRKCASWYCEGVLPEENVSTDEALRQNGISMAPSIYEGDLIEDTNHHLSGVVTLPDGRIIMVFPTNGDVAASAHSNKGKIAIIEDNTHWTIYNNITLGHANGVTYDNKRGKLLITPLFDYSGGRTDQSWPVVLEFDVDNITAEPTVVNAPYNFMGIAYNYVTQLTYVTRWGGGDIYTYDGTGFNKLVTLILPSDTRSYNQGFAASGDYCYISDSNNYFGVYSLKDGAHIKEFFLDQYDQQGWYNLGELEDFDFDKNGNLYAARFSHLSGYHIDAFYTYIPLDTYKVNPNYQGYGLKNWTFSINNTSIGTFKNSFVTMKHLEQINMFGSNRNMVKSVNCNFTTDIGMVDLGVDVVLNVTQIKCSKINTTKQLILSSATEDNLCTFTHTDEGADLGLLRGAELKLLNTEGNLNFSVPDSPLNIRIDAWLPFICIRANVIVNGTNSYEDGSVVQIGDVPCSDDIRGVYNGSTRIYSYA